MKIKSNTSLSLRKVLLSALVAAPLATLPAPLWAIPQVTGYTGNTTATNVTSNSTATTFTYIPAPASPAPFPITSTTLQITDTVTNRLVLKWNEFGSGFSPINAGESVIWTLPSSTSAVLNMVTGGSATLISGGAPGASLSSNGSIFIVNPNGITLGAGASVTASGFGMSTVTQNEFYFLANGTLDPSTTALAAATTNIVSAGTINVGSTGNVILSGRSVDVAGTITGGTLTVNTTTGGTGARLAQTAALTLGTAGTAASGTAAEVPGTGDLIINSNGGPVVLSGAGAFTTAVNGGDVTIDSGGGAISQGAAAVIIGDTLSDAKLKITAGTGTVTLGNLDVSPVGSQDARLDVTINSAAATSLKIVDDIRLMASTITGTLSIESTKEDIAVSGSSTVSGAVTLKVPNKKDISFNAAGDVTFAAITSGTDKDSDVTLVSGGSIVLPSISAGGNITVTAATNISQVALSTIKNDYDTGKRAKFEATTGSVTLSNTTNDFGNVQLVGSPGGVTLVDTDDVTIFKDTNVTGNVSITAGSVIFGRGAGDVITFNGNLTVDTTASGTGVGDVTVVSGGAYTAAPTVSFAGGGAGTTTLAVTGVTVAAGLGGVGFTTAPTITITEGTSTATGTSTIDLNAIDSFTGGAGYTSAPTVTISGGGGTVVTNPTATLGVTTLALGGAQAGYVVGDTINVAGAGSTAPAVITVTAVTGGAITGFTVTPGAGFTSLAPAGLTATTATGVGAGATITTAAGFVDALTAPAGTGFTAQPTVTFTGGGGTTLATAKVEGTIGTVTITNGGSGFTLGGAATVAASTSGSTTAPTFNAPVGTVTDVVVTASGAGFTAAPAITFSAGTTLATGTAVLGAGTGGSITDATNNLTVIGASQLNALGPITLDGATSSGIGLNNRFGVINVSQSSMAGVTLYESTTLNLGSITTSGKLRAYSSAGEVIDTGPLVVGAGLVSAAAPGAVVVGAEFGAGTAAAPGNVTIDSAGTTISGRIAILDDVALVTNMAAPQTDTAVIGTYLANNVNITTAGTITVGRVINTAGAGIAGNLALTATSAGSDILLPDGVGAAGTVSLTAADAITASDSENVISNVTVVAGGDVSVRSDSNLTVNATLTQNAAGKVAKFEANGLQIGTVNSDYTGTVQAGTPNSAQASVWFRSNGSNDLVDNVNGMRVFGAVLFDSNRHITINNAGHSFGMVSAATRGNNGNITITESGGLRLGTVTTNGRGSFTATSTSGDILQTVSENGIRLGNGETGTATFNAALGAVTLNDNDQTGTADVDEDNTNNIAIINVTAGGNVVINNPRVDGAGVVIGPVTLGNVTAGGSLSVDSANRHTAGVAVAAGASNIVQSSSGRVNSFGLTTFTASGAAAITIGNTGNRMGGVIATTGTGAITLTESPTLNLIGIQTTGALAARSETDSIVDTAFTIPAAPAGNTTAAPVNSLGTAAAPLSGTFTASSADGHVILDLAANNFGVVGFTTGGNVSILDSVNNTTLAASTIGGTLDVINTQGAVVGPPAVAAGVVNQSGALSVTGNVTLTTNGGGVDLSNTANMFGGVRFAVGASGALIAENTTLNLRAGSTSTGPVQLVTNGDFITSGAGASSITNNLTIQAQGTIIPGAGSLLVTGVFTVFSPSLKDLSALSKSGNLLNRDPVNLGSGPYVPPSL